MGLSILMVAACPFPSRRGTPLRVQRLAEALIRRGHRVEIATYAVAEVAEETGLVVRRAGRPEVRPMPPGPNWRKLLLDPRLARLIGRRLREGRFDLVHAHHVEGVFVSAAACRRHRLPLVYDAHTLVGTELPTFAPRLARPLSLLGGLVDRLACRLADGVLAVTPDIRDALVNRLGVAADRAVVAMNGVEIEIFRAADVEPEPATVFYSGTTAGYQDLDLLLRAFARARREATELRLVLSLSGDDSQLKALAGELGIADALTIVADSFARLPDRLARAAIVVLPRTHCDGIPQKLLNYMAAARPVVVSAGSAKIGRHGEELLVVPNGDVAAFAAAILRLHRDPALAERLGAAARRFVEARCSWEATAIGAEGLYARLLAPAADPAVTGG
ncbi:D-inositol 3-phosphate glycosyltransferase [bacterium HR40]|nr:D-inositol 3-phosphate glycosyltransferase [bacterium HR40]